MNFQNWLEKNTTKLIQKLEKQKNWDEDCFQDAIIYLLSKDNLIDYERIIVIKYKQNLIDKQRKFNRNINKEELDILNSDSLSLTHEEIDSENCKKETNYYVKIRVLHEIVGENLGIQYADYYICYIQMFAGNLSKCAQHLKISRSKLTNIIEKIENLINNKTEEIKNLFDLFKYPTLDEIRLGNLIND